MHSAKSKLATHFTQELLSTQSRISDLYTCSRKSIPVSVDKFTFTTCAQDAITKQLRVNVSSQTQTPAAFADGELPSFSTLHKAIGEFDIRDSQES